MAQVENQQYYSDHHIAILFDHHQALQVTHFHWHSSPSWNSQNGQEKCQPSRRLSWVCRAFLSGTLVDSILGKAQRKKELKKARFMWSQIITTDWLNLFFAVEQDRKSKNTRLGDCKEGHDRCFWHFRTIHPKKTDHTQNLRRSSKSLRKAAQIKPNSPNSR